MLKRLTEIGLKHNTDKAYFHLFTDFYNDYFERIKPVNILEIGIAHGASLLLLKEYFPTANIYAIDIEPHSVNLYLGKNVHKYLCSQDNFEELKKIFDNITFDIIIDDGSHKTSHQQSSLGFFFPYLNKNGIYICEDLHTSYRKEYCDTNITTIDMLEYYQKYKIIKSDSLNENQKLYLNENIADLIIYERTENAIKCWACNSYNYNKKELCHHCNTNLSPTDKSITSIIIHK
jgi:23S rRNA U2552 (ribose-2'-O)-methylase RlmE/FtsJ